MTIFGKMIAACVVCEFERQQCFSPELLRVDPSPEGLGARLLLE